MIWNSHTGIACNDGGSFVCSLWAFSADFRVLWVSPLGVLLSCRPPRPPVVSDNISLRYVMWEGKAASRPRATPATSPRNITHVLVHWESCLQGSEIPAAEPARADSDIRAITTITDSWLELACARAGVRYHPSRLPSLLAKRFFTSKRSLALRLLPDDTTCIRLSTLQVCRAHCWAVTCARGFKFQVPDLCILPRQICAIQNHFKRNLSLAIQL